MDKLVTAIENSVQANFFEKKLVLDPNSFDPLPSRDYPYIPRSFKMVYQGTYYGHPVCVIVSDSEAQANEIDKWWEDAKFDEIIKKDPYLQLIDTGRASDEANLYSFLITQRFEPGDLCDILLRYSRRSDLSTSVIFKTVFNMFTTISKHNRVGYRDIYVVNDEIKFGRECDPTNENLFAPQFFMEILKNFFWNSSENTFVSWDFRILFESLSFTLRTGLGRETLGKKVKCLLSVYPDNQSARWIKDFIILNVDSVKDKNFEREIRREINNTIMDVFRFNQGDLPLVYHDHWRRTKRGDRYNWEEMLASRDDRIKGVRKGAYWEETGRSSDGPWTILLRKMIWGFHCKGSRNAKLFGKHWRYGNAFEFLNQMRILFKHGRQNNIFLSTEEIVDIIHDTYPHILGMFQHFLIETNTMVYPVIVSELE